MKMLRKLNSSFSDNLITKVYRAKKGYSFDDNEYNCHLCKVYNF